jgi:hemerythrin-like metal-binding protein
VVVQSISWTDDDSVFVPQIDAEHEKLFEGAESMRQFLAHSWVADHARFPLWRFSQDFLAHLNSEERLMRTSRYAGLNWHERQHQTGRKKLARLTDAVHRGNQQAVREALQDVAVWMHDHITVADRMFAAHLRNEMRERLAS